jgi:hypothetical protein
VFGSVQDMLFAMRVIQSIGSRVRKPMMLTIDNKGAVDYANNLSSSGRMRHACIKLSFIRELKEKGVINVNWCKSEEMPADLFTKNLSGPIFKRHTATFCGSIMIEVKGSVGVHFLLITLTMI